MNRRKFIGHLAKGAAAVAILGATTTLSGCNPTADIPKVISLLKTISGIVATVGTLVGALDPAITLPLGMAMAAIAAAFLIVQNILTQYETNLSGAPTSVIQTLDNAIAAVETQIASIEALFPGLSALVKAGISVALTAFQTILGFIASLLPAPAASSLFPRSFAALSARHIVFGVAANIPTRRQFSQNYNSQMTASGWPERNCHIHVPLFN